MKTLLQNSFQVDCKSSKGRTPLMACARQLSSAGIKLLLDYGADPLEVDNANETALSQLLVCYNRKEAGKMTGPRTPDELTDAVQSCLPLLCSALKSNEQRNHPLMCKALYDAVRLVPLPLFKILLRAGIGSSEGNPEAEYFHLCCVQYFLTQL
eukprot:Filipodium_phascolosomae@DN8175_c0_g1_i1.p1